MHYRLIRCGEESIEETFDRQVKTCRVSSSLRRASWGRGDVLQRRVDELVRHASKKRR